MYKFLAKDMLRENILMDLSYINGYASKIAKAWKPETIKEIVTPAVYEYIEGVRRGEPPKLSKRKQDTVDKFFTNCEAVDSDPAMFDRLMMCVFSEFESLGKM